MRWKDADAEVKAGEAERSEVGEQLQGQLSEVNDGLSACGVEPVRDAAQAAGRIRDLEKRVAQFQNARRDLRDAERTLEEAEERLSELQDDRSAIFTGLDLEPGDTERLRELCELHADYVERRKERDDRRAVLQSEGEKLRRHGDFERHLEEQSLAELKDQERELREMTEEYENVWGDISRIQDRIARAKQRHDVEEAMAERERSLDALEERLADDCGRMVGQVLADWGRQMSTEANQPDVFAGAREILTTISRGRYRLDVDQGPEPTFRAYDTVKERGFGLEELSSATRLQLLLAVRMAFVQHQEDSVHLPLLLDETLGNTDDARASVIIDSAIELAREGRQIFYFTAQGDEVARWLAALEGAEGVEHVVRDLAEIQGLDARVEVPDLEAYSVDRPRVPEPDGLDHRAYGQKLGVRPFDPRSGAGSAHVWHVVGDVHLLHRLLELEIRRWGQLSNLLETGDEKLISDDPDRLRKLRENGSALEAFVRAWRIGRGRPVDRAVLEDSGAVSDTFIDEVSDLAERLDGNGEAIIEALREGEVARFRTDKIEELEVYLEDADYIDPAEPLDGSEVRRHVVSRLIEADLSRETAIGRADELLDRLVPK
jgi:hypothetical protein